MGFLDIIKLAFPSKFKSSDPESATTDFRSGGHGGGSYFLTRSTLSGGPPVRPAGPVHVDTYGRPTISADDNLNLFRYLTGIISHPSMVQTDSIFSNTGARVAPNMGIYPRVVKNEQEAKLGYKYFSALVNLCLGLQIIVAATLTALGAAGGSRGSVTVFGATNTIIAGILTFLKGSGLPNRFKFYQQEWQRTREFIEQRERDFSRPGCDLEVYGVVAMVEAMYEEVKTEIEASQPDRYAGPSSARQPATQQKDGAYPVPRFSLPKTWEKKRKDAEAGLGSRFEGIAGNLSHLADEAKGVAKDLQAQRTNLTDDANKGMKDLADSKDGTEHMLGDKLDSIAQEIGQRVQEADDLVKDHIQDDAARAKQVTDDAVKEAREHLERSEAAAREKTASMEAAARQRAADAYRESRENAERAEAAAREQAASTGTAATGTLDRMNEAARQNAANWSAATSTPANSNVPVQSTSAQETEKKLAGDY